MTPEKEHKLLEAAKSFIKNNENPFIGYYNSETERNEYTDECVQLAMIKFAKSTEVAEYHKQSPAESDGWISVEERLPEQRVNTVLAFNGNAPEYNQHAFIADYFTQTNSWSPSHKIIGSVTHWQPLPAAPKPKT